MYDPSKSVPLDSRCTYEVSGNSLMQMNNCLEKVYADLNWLRSNLSDHLAGLASGGDDCFVKFVARVGLVLQTLNSITSKWNSFGLSGAAHHLELKKLTESDRSSSSGEVG